MLSICSPLHAQSVTAVQRDDYARSHCLPPLAFSHSTHNDAVFPEALPTPSTVPCASACAHSPAYPPVVLSPLSAAAPCSGSAVTKYTRRSSPSALISSCRRWLNICKSASPPATSTLPPQLPPRLPRTGARTQAWRASTGGRLCLVRPSLIHSPCARGATLASSRSSRSACTTRAQASPCERAAAQTSPAAESRKAAAAAGCLVAAGWGRAARRRVASCTPPAA